MENSLASITHSTSGRSSGEIERWASLAAATTLMVYGISRRNTSGLCLAAAATPFAYKGLVGTWPGLGNGYSDTRVALSGGRGIHVLESTRLEKPVDEVYRFWRRLENLPRVFAHIEQVTELDEVHSHWSARTVGGFRVEWAAEIINEVPNKVIGWKSSPGSDVTTAGSVNFSSVRGGRSTQVTVHLQYALPGGRAAALFATLLGQEPSQTIREDLRQLKQLLEAGEVPRATAATGGRHR